jgi:hypothetical protein
VVAAVVRRKKGTVVVAAAVVVVVVPTEVDAEVDEEAGVDVDEEAGSGTGRADEATQELHPDGDDHDHGGVHGGVRGDVRDGVHDDVHACADAYARHLLGCLHHLGGWTDCPEHCWAHHGLSLHHKQKNEEDRLAKRGHGKDGHDAQTLPLSELPYQRVCGREELLETG